MKTFGKFINEGKSKKLGTKAAALVNKILASNKSIYKEDRWYIQDEYQDNGCQLGKYLEWKGEDGDIPWIKKDSVIELILVSAGDIAGRKEIDLNSLSNKELLNFLNNYKIK